MRVTYEDVKRSEEIRTYITQADASLIALGYTEHSFAHVTRRAEVAGDLLAELGYDEHQIELCKIAAYMHDIGNVVNRHDHNVSGATMAFRILDNMGMEPEDVAAVITAIGHHDDATAFPVNAIAAALILADKTDVRRVGPQPGDHQFRHPRPGELRRGALRGLAGPGLQDLYPLPVHQHGGLRRDGLF